MDTRAQTQTPAVQLRWRSIGHGCVELVLENLPPGFAEELAKGAQFGGKNAMVLRLAYPRQGQMFGAQPIEERNAAKLNEATAALNVVLDECYSR